MSLIQDPQEQRKEGDRTRAASGESYAQADRSDPGWAEAAEAAFGQAANAYTVVGKQYMVDRRIGHNSVGDGKNYTGDSLHGAANGLETHDTEAGTTVRRTITEA
jgi:hypothetical protein